MFHSFTTIVREAVSRKKRESTFREDGEITAEEFLEAGEYLTTRFPQWKWSDADTPGTRSKHLEGEKRQFIAIRGVACHHRLDDTFAGDAVQNETTVGDGEGFRRDAGSSGMPGDDEDGWLRTGKLAESQEARTRDVRTVDESGNIGDREPDEEDKIPNMDDMMVDEEDDMEAIIRDPIVDTTGLFRKYNVYIAYAPGYNTPRIYLSGYYADNTPLPPHLMMEDIVGDYRDKTVTLENFPHFKNHVLMASVHPCKHAPVMKILLDRADNALKIRREKQKMGLGGTGSAGLEGLVDNMTELGMRDKAKEDQQKHAEDEWEVVQDESNAEKKEVAIRVDQYLVVFLKFISSVTPTIEYDSTMGI